MTEEIKEILQTLDGIASGDWIQMLPKEANKLLDYITNLQQKINDNNSDISNLTYQLAQIKEENEKLKDWNKKLIRDDLEYVNKSFEQNNYKSRCEKAIKYINNNKLYDFDYDKEELFEIVTDKIAKEYLLNILNGGDEK